LAGGIVANSFLKPRSIALPTQGAFKFVPEVIIHESDTAAGLAALLNGDVVVQSSDLDNFYVVEHVEYQVAVLQPMLGGNPPILSYSALVHLTRANKI
jgi:hypothetical protein